MATSYGGCCLFIWELLDLACDRDVRIQAGLGGFIASYKYFEVSNSPTEFPILFSHALVQGVADEIKAQFTFQPHVRAPCDAILANITLWVVNIISISLSCHSISLNKVRV